ncbi:MAG: VIT domain-containing protein [Anaerolineae bacterium]|nr:VIT domain-containing protein [Anaerolineae bacterium]MDW8171618.1 VIT domain-containing protein [Anaerolineae bacterium]
MFRRLFALLSSLLALSLSAAQAQVILPPPPGGGVITDPRWLAIDYLRVDVDIDQQIAETLVKMQFTNRGEGLAEGTFLFPLPRGAAVQRLTMIVNGQAIDAKILKADEARRIYDAIVRQYRDPALLEYVGRDLIQANVFPIPRGESRQIEIRYGELLRESNGLVNYSYPLKTPLNASRRLEQFSLRVRIRDAAPLGSVYSPTHRVALSRPTERETVVGFETSATTPDQDFELYYGVQRRPIDANLLTYKASASEDGFFLLMIQPPQALNEAQIVAKDVVIVLDQSGSMLGEKWTQAQRAAVAILDKLNPRDRFNVIVFSTGWRNYANELLSADQAAQASRWVNSLYAEGSTNIHDALSAALQYTDAERPMILVFLTDGLATEGITDTNAILESIKRQARPNVRIFSFGVGDDVDTTLLDRLAQEFGGLSSYVRPYERIDEEVEALYSRISAPVMTDASLRFEGVTAELLYPRSLGALYAGEQVTVVGRYRNPSAQARVILSGEQDGQEQTIVYDDLVFDDRAGGAEFIARLWATRRIGDLLNSIRLHGESQELVNSVVELSIRYGIITPYTSFLIEEDDILSAAGRERAQDSFGQQAQALARSSSGGAAVDAADLSGQLQQAEQAIMPSMLRSAPAPSAAGLGPQATQGAPGSPIFVPASPPSAPVGSLRDAEEGALVQPIQQVRAKTFIQQNGIWTDTAYQPDRMTPVQVAFLSDEYFALLTRYPEAGEYLALGEQVIVVLDGTAYQVVP